ncbi:MAG: phosphatase PAP2 family protein [Lachnotalea sp.]
MEFLIFLAQCRTPFLTQIFRVFTFLGEEVFAISIICFLYWCYNKKLARMIGLVFFTSGLIVQSLKLTFCIPRPWILYPTFKPVLSSIDTATGYSFPSGHTQSSSSLFGALGIHSKKAGPRMISVILIIGVGFSRMYLGYHTPWDVLASMSISLFIVYLFNKVIPLKTYKVSTVAISLAAFTTMTLIYVILFSKNPNTDLSQFHDCFKAIGAGMGFALGWYIEPLYINFDEKNGNFQMQIVKLLLGLLVAVIIKSGLKLILGTSLTADTLRYFILVCWIMILYPIIIVKMIYRKN